MILTAFFTFFISSSQAGGVYSCQDLFNDKSLYQINRIIEPIKKFNPMDAQSIIDFLTRPEINQILKKINKNKDNLDFYEDHISALARALEYINTEMESKKPTEGLSDVKHKVDIIKEAQGLMAEIHARQIQKKMTYYWIWKISLKVSAVKEMMDFFGGTNAEAQTRNMSVLSSMRSMENIKFRDDRSELEKIILMNGREVLPLFKTEMIFGQESVTMPVLARLNFSNILSAENILSFATIPLELQTNHALERTPYADSTSHDLVHALNDSIDRVSAGPQWPIIHRVILARIEELSGADKRYTEFIYFYLLREIHQRTAIVNILEGATKEVPFSRKDGTFLLRRLMHYKDFGQDFTDVADKSEIIRIGIENLTRIFDQIRSSRR